MTYHQLPSVVYFCCNFSVFCCLCASIFKTFCTFRQEVLYLLGEGQLLSVVICLLSVVFVPQFSSDKRSCVCLVGEGQLPSVVMETKVTTKAKTSVQRLS